jgi:hypothetical protein
MVSRRGEVVSGNLCLDKFMYVSPLKAQEGTEFHGAQARLAACGMVANPALGDAEFCRNFFGGVKTIRDIWFRRQMNGDCKSGILDGHIGTPFGYEDLFAALFSVSGNGWIDAKPIASTGRT